MKRTTKTKTNLFQAVKTAAFEAQPKAGLGTRWIPSKKKTVAKFRYDGEN